MKKDVYIPYDEDENFFTTLTIPGFDAFNEDKSDLPEGVFGVYELSRRADYMEVAEFAKNITDDFSEDIPLYQSQIPFSRMSLPQMRRYFTLRESFRKGHYECSFESYLILYLTEIINLIGFPTYEKAASEIASVMTERSRINKDFLPICKALFRDFYVTYNIPGSFYEFAETFGVEKYFPDSVIPENTDVRAAVFYHNAHYRIPKTTGFFAQHYSAESFLRKAFFAVIKNLEAAFSYIGKPIKTLEADYFGRYENFVPFSGVKFYKTPTRVGKAVITPSESYEVSERGIKANLANLPESAEIFFGFVLSVIEANMRNLCGYKYSLTLDQHDTYEKISETYDRDSHFYMSLMCTDEVPQIIMETVIDLYNKSVRFIVKDGVSGFSKTSENLKKMLSAEPFTTFASLTKKSKESKDDPPAIFKTESDKLWKLTGNYAEDEFAYGRYSRLTELSPKDFAAYISIRTRVRKGDFENAPGFFWGFWLSELINTERITPEEVFTTLAAYLKKLNDTKIKSTMMQYYALHLSEKGSFKDFTDKNGVSEFFTKVFSSGDFSFDEMNEISDYKISKSKFYSDKTAPVFEAVIPKLFETISGYLGQYNIDLRTVLYEKSVEEDIFFRGLIHPIIRLEPNTEIIISENLAFRYAYADTFTVKFTEPENKIMPIIIGVIMKNAEIAIREVMNGKGKISISERIPDKLKTKLIAKIPPRIARTKAGKAALIQWRTLCEIVLGEEFTDLLHATVRKLAGEISPETLTKYIPKPEPIKVEINFEALGEIRADSKEVAERLGAVYAENEPEEKIKQPQNPPQKTAPPADINKEFLRLLIDGKKEEAKKLALENGTMFEVIAEQINEIFTEKIGDIVIENDEIIEDYLGDVKLFIGE
jgi:hypothetical protein